MSLENFSLQQLEDLWIELWREMFDLEVEGDETKETATVLQEFVRRVNAVSASPSNKEEPKKKKEEDLKTLSQWNAEGRWIIKGEKARAFQAGVAVFAYEQTREAVRKKTSDKGARPQGYQDDLEDDIPF